MNNRTPLRSRLPGRRPLSAAIAAVTLTLAGSAALASEHAGDPQSQTQSGTDQTNYGSQADGPQTQSFNALDQDGNGYLSRSELQSSDAPQANLDNLDSDDDGQVSRSEFAAMATGAMDQGQGMTSQGSSSQRSASEDSSSSESSMAQSGTSQSSSSQSSSSQSSSSQGQHGDAVTKISEQEESLSTFTQALQETGMADALTDDTKYTIFAPTNDAFESHSGKSVEELMKPENREELVSLLRAHIVADDVDQQMAENISEAQTIDGGTVSLTMEDDTLQVGDASVTGSSIQEGSLRVYPIDAVLEPQAGAQTASSSSSSGQSDSSSQSGSSSQQTAFQGMEFSELDQDGDGYLSQEELQQAQGIDSPEEAAQRLDTDQDGQVSRSEFAAFEESGSQSGSASGSDWDSQSERQSDDQQ